jgi:pilus assembly protein CpaE
MKRADIIGFVSIKGGVGKTTAAANVANSLARKLNKKVLLVDANFSAPSLHSYFNMKDVSAGIIDVLVGSVNSSEAVHKVGKNLDLLPVTYGASKINYQGLRQVLTSFRADYDFIIVDSSPALNEETLAAIVASDKLFVVSTPDHVTLNSTMHALKLARQKRTYISGIVLNKIRDKSYEITAREIEEHTGVGVVSVVNDDENILKSLSKERKLVTNEHPSSSSAKEYKSLAYALCGQKYNKFSLKGMFSNKISQEEINRTLLMESHY